MRKFLQDCFTGVDGETYDLGRALWALAALAPILVALVQVVGSGLALLRSGTPLPLWTAEDWVAWAGGVSALLVAGAGALHMKRGTEPSTTTTAAATTPGAAVVEQSNG